MKITEQKQHNKTTTPHITWFTPSVGATSTNCVLFLFPQNHSLSAHTAADLSSSLIAAHTAAGFCAHSCRSFFPPYKIPLHTQLQRSSTHTAGTCPFLTKPILLALSFLTSKSLTYPFYISAYLYCAVLQNPGLKPWAPTKTLNPGFKPWAYYKQRGF